MLESVRPGVPRLPEWAHALIFLIVGLLGWYFLDDTWVRMLFLVTLYATLGMGLNVVVGLVRPAGNQGYSRAWKTCFLGQFPAG